MRTEKRKCSAVNTALIFLVLVNVVGDIANVALWYGGPPDMYGPGGSQGSLRGGLIASIFGGDIALAIGSILLALVAATYAYSMIGLLRRQKRAAVLVIAISLVNRTLALVIFEFSGAFYVWLAWTVVLVAFAYLGYRRLMPNS